MKWLHVAYVQKCNREEELVAAAQGGHTEVVNFSALNCVRDIVRALDKAAANGNVAMVDALLSTSYRFELRRRILNDVGPFLTAAENGHTNVLRLYLEKR